MLYRTVHCLVRYTVRQPMSLHVAAVASGQQLQGAATTVSSCWTGMRCGKQTRLSDALLYNPDQLANWNTAQHCSCTSYFNSKYAASSGGSLGVARKVSSGC